MPELRSLAAPLASLAWVAVRSFLGTLSLFLLAGLVLAGVSFYLLQEANLWYALLGAVLAVAEGLTIGVILGGKRAGIMALAHGLRRLGLGRVAVGLIFDRLLGMSEGEAFGERGNWAAQQLERLPLAQAEARLSGAINDLVQGSTGEGWLRRWLQGRLLRSIQKYTLTRFREEGAKTGGVDLLKVKADLETHIEDLLIAKLRGGLNLWTLWALLGLPALVAGQTYLAILLLQPR
jgi:hypothetical protein